MKIYHYEAKTREYLGEGEAEIDRITSKRQGRECYLIPANATAEKLTLKDKRGFAIIWDGRAWKYVEDHRGKEVWRKADGEKVVVDWLGAIGDEYTETEPPKPEGPPPSVEDLQKQMEKMMEQIQALKEKEGAENEPS